MDTAKSLVPKNDIQLAPDKVLFLLANCFEFEEAEEQEMVALNVEEKVVLVKEVVNYFVPVSDSCQVVGQMCCL